MGGAGLRGERRERVFGAMEGADLDVLVLGRRDSIAYATGARSLWTAGTRPFGAACVMVREGRSTHLLSTWDTGVPPEVPFENLYGITWNPATMLASLRAIPGLTDARRLGVDALSPGFVRAIPRLAPAAELVAADDILRAVRAVKLPAEVERIRAASRIAADGVAAALAALSDGAERADALAAAQRAVPTVPSSGLSVEITPGMDSVDVGVMVDGYEGGRGRTICLDGDGARYDAAHRALVAACRPAVTADDLRPAAATWWMVRGNGMGFEPPVFTPDRDAPGEIQAGMVLSVEVRVGTWRRRDVVHVGPDATEVLS